MPKLQKRVSKKDSKESESYAVTLLKDLITILGWSEGDMLIERLTEDKKGIIIERP